MTENSARDFIKSKSTIPARDIAVVPSLSLIRDAREITGGQRENPRNQPRINHFRPPVRCWGWTGELAENTGGWGSQRS